MEIKNLKGTVHIRDGKQFVRVNKTNLVKALTACGKLPPQSQFLTKAELLARCEFGANGDLTNVRN